MTAKKPLPDRVQMKGLDALFGLDQDQKGQVIVVSIAELFPLQKKTCSRDRGVGPCAGHCA